MTSSRSSLQNKRLFKYLKVLSNDLNVDFDNIESTSSLYVLLGNVGLSTGNGYDDIYNLFVPIGKTRNIYLFADKRYSLVEFDDIDSATDAVSSLNGTLIPSFNKKIYVTQIACSVAQILINQCQQNIFKQFSHQPKGLTSLSEIISEDEESLLLGLIDWSTDDKVERLKNRKVKHFGRRFNYTVNGIEENTTIEPIPGELLTLISRWKNDHIIEYVPDQITVNYYEKGQGIPMHIDTHSCCENEIVSLSLCSDIVMDFEKLCTNGEDRRQNNDHRYVLLKRRSLLILKDEARYCWRHGIVRRKYDVFPDPSKPDKLIFKDRSIRVSFTFRRYKNSKCSCDFPEFCDSRKNKEMEITDFANMENEYVYKVYNQIADDFNRTRYKPWPRVKSYLDSLPLGSILCDIGCGNGKYLNLNKNIISIGSDTSLQLLEICKNRKMEVLACNILNLPIRSSSIDHVICIAVIHHLASRERRLNALVEISRVLVTGGTGLVYVWALEQVKDGTASVYLKSKESDQQTISISSPMSNLSIHDNRTEFKQQDLFVPWKDKNSSKEFLRYYHVFKEHELEGLFKDIPELGIIESYYDQGNWAVVFKKIHQSLQTQTSKQEKNILR